MHVVFCRNVLIYFGREPRAGGLRQLAASAAPGGFIGVADGERLAGATPAGRAFAPFAADQRIHRYEH